MVGILCLYKKWTLLTGDGSIQNKKSTHKKHCAFALIEIGSVAFLSHPARMKWGVLVVAGSERVEGIETRRYVLKI